MQSNRKQGFVYHGHHVVLKPANAMILTEFNRFYKTSADILVKCSSKVQSDEYIKLLSFNFSFTT
jgi:hypothetical protein